MRRTTGSGKSHFRYYRILMSFIGAKLNRMAFAMLGFWRNEQRPIHRDHR